MPSSSDTPVPAHDIASGLRRLATLPGWLTAALQGAQVADALLQHVPEFASGALTLSSCKVKRLLLKDTSGRWTGTYNLVVAGPDGQRQTIEALGTLSPPGLRQRAIGAEPAAPFGSAGWRCFLPELGLELESQPPETELFAMPQLTEPEAARAMLERSISAGAPAYHDLRIAACVPEVLSYKPGSRCTIRYHLEYPAELRAGHTWPATVIAKTYRKESKGRNAYDGMLALWNSPLAAGDTVTIAEPLAFIPELKVLIQGPVAAEDTLEDRLKSALSAGTPDALAELNDLMRKTATGLAALHRSGAHSSATARLEDRFREIRELIDRLVVAAPELAGAVAPVLARLEELAARHPADPPVPTHGTFNPEQVMLHAGQIGFIDFDDFCLAEPALDVGLFRAAIKDTGMNAHSSTDREARLARLDLLTAIGDAFLAQYQAEAPIDRQRVLLWEAWSYLRDSLHYWIKVKPSEPDNALLTLEHHLRGMGLW